MTPQQNDERVFAVVRLGKDSEEIIQRLDAADAGDELPMEFEIRCKQVPEAVGPGSFAFIWLGTNNNKGGATPWTQGLRALGRITHIEGGPQYNDTKTVGISVGVVFPKSLTKSDFVRQASGEYIRISDLPVVGINNYSSQVVQRINGSEDTQQMPVLMSAIAGLAPGFTDAVATTYDELRDLLPQDAPPPEGQVEPLPRNAEAALLAVDIPEGNADFTELLARVKRLLKDGFGGVILRGPPGTSKSWYARRLAAALVDRDASRIRFVQFHPSYQYEDFVEGLVPDEEGTFRPLARHFLQICDDASKDLQRDYVLVIDELSRTDPARVFGEGLTYLEQSKRGEEFSLASGRKTHVPSNLVVIATMNVWDRGVDEVDAAVERRFASIAMDPDRKLLAALLKENAVEEGLRANILRFFDSLQKDPNPMVKVGHAYFAGVRDESGLHRLWQHQLRFVIERAFPLEQDGLKRITGRWEQLFPLIPAEAAEAAPPAAEATA
jgi:5-methylcytosine-specific restriction protein B